MHDFKLTKREAIFSLVIVFLLLFIGFFISESISNNVAEKNEIYYKATKINNSKEQFQNSGVTTNKS